MYHPVRLRIEGIDIPVTDVTLSSAINQPAQASFVVPARKELMNMHPFCTVEIFVKYGDNWLLAFTGFFVGISPSFSTSTSQYRLTAYSRDWFLTRFPIGYTSLDDLYYSYHINKNKGVTGAIHSDPKSAIMSTYSDTFTVTVMGEGSSGSTSDNIDVRGKATCKVETKVPGANVSQNAFATRIVAGVSKLVNSGMNEVFKAYYSRMGFDKLISDYISDTGAFFDYFASDALLRKVSHTAGGDTIRDKLSIILQAMLYEQTVQLFPSMHGSSSMHYYHIKPNMMYANIPACNVVPLYNNVINFSTDFTSRPTRLMLRVPTITGSDTHTYYWAPKYLQDDIDEYTPHDNIDVRQTTGGSSSNQKITTTPEEKNKYCINAIMQDLGMRYPASKGECNNNYYQHAAANLLWRYQYASRNMTVTGQFNPQVLVGFPIAIAYLDDIFVGVLEGVTHNLMENTTSYSIAYARSIQEDGNNNVPDKNPWVSDDYYGSTDSYYEYMNTSTGLTIVGKTPEQVITEYGQKYTSWFGGQTPKNQIDRETELVSRRTNFVTVTDFDNLIDAPNVADTYNADRYNSVLDYARRLDTTISFAGV